MTVTTVTDQLERNLSVLGEANASVAAMIRRSEPADLDLNEIEDGTLVGSLHGKALCSRHQPRTEAQRLADRVDLIEHGVVVVFGFGLGYHVETLARRMQRAGVVIVVEPDVQLLRSVFGEVDHSDWLRDSLVVFVTDVEDRGSLARQLEGCQSVIAQGVEFVEHPPSRSRVGDATLRFTKMFSDYVQATKITFMTTLVRSVDTIRNVLLNIDHYVQKPGIAELKNIARGFPAVVVSAGPSLRRNVDLLADPDVRERCVIIAVQTTLKPLLERGIRPHFVTALDYAEISTRFYEGLTAEDVQGVTLIAEPKAHPAILDAFPGAVRCCASGFVDKLLGEVGRDMGTLAAGATVAHMAVYLARFLGCNPIALIGQDLAFTDGLYYAPGTAIHDVWSTELNPFNTIEMMEWQRIVRHRQHLHRVDDIHGRSIYTDAQMHAYLQQFERDFAAFTSDGTRIIDATEGGAQKQHAELMPLQTVLDTFATRQLPAALSIDNDDAGTDTAYVDRCAERLAATSADVEQIGHVAGETVQLVERMLADQSDAARMAEHFRQLDALRGQVEQRFSAFELINHLNQMGVFKRFKADRRLQMQAELSPLDRQRAQLERDLVNVQWTQDAAGEMSRQLHDAQRVLAGDVVRKQPRAPEKLAGDAVSESNDHLRIGAIIPVAAAAMSLTNHSVIDATALRNVIRTLSATSQIDEIVLIVDPEVPINDEEVAQLGGNDKRIRIVQSTQPLFGPEHEAIHKARLFARHCWRGAIAGLTVFDEVLCPQAMLQVMESHDIDAAVIIGPGWSAISATDDHGVDALVERYRNCHEQLQLVFNQAPPGAGLCLLDRKLISQLAQRSRFGTVGSLLAYHPTRPQHDPIARDNNVQINHEVRRQLTRLPVRKAPTQPQHLMVEITTDRVSSGRTSLQQYLSTHRPAMSVDQLQGLLQQIDSPAETVLTFAGVGDPLCHDTWPAMINIASQVGIGAVHVRTELPGDHETMQRLLDTGVDVISVELHADSPVVYERMFGVDRFDQVLSNLQYLIDHRRVLAGPAGPAAIALPWIVPRLQRCDATFDDLEGFFDRWQHLLGTAVIESMPDLALADDSHDPIEPAVTPQRVVEHQLQQRMFILSDGRVPISELDINGDGCIGNFRDHSLSELWKQLQASRSSAGQARSEIPLGLLFP